MPDNHVWGVATNPAVPPVISMDGSLVAVTTLGRPLILGAAAIATCAMAVVLWMLVAPIASAVIAQGVVVVENSVRSVQHADGGLIKNIFVHDGTVVTSGQVLIQLNTEKQDILQQALETGYALLLARKARLHAELEERNDLVPPKGDEAEILSRHMDLFEDQRGNFQARKRSLSLRALELENDCNEDIAAISGLQKQLSQLRRLRALAAPDPAAAADLASRGSGTRRALREARGTSASLAGEEAAAETRVAELVAHVAHTRIEKERIAAAFLEEDQAELQQVTRDEQEVRQHLLDAELNLKHSSITAPIDGTIINLSAHTIGGVVTPGESLLEIVPSKEPLTIEAQIQPVDSDDVSVGLPVMIRMMGAGAQRMPMVAGIVSSISADRIYDKGRAPGYFLVRVSVDRAKLMAARGIDLRPGIPVEIMIQKSPRSMISYLINPVMKTFSHALRE